MSRFQQLKQLKEKEEELRKIKRRVNMLKKLNHFQSQCMTHDSDKIKLILNAKVDKWKESQRLKHAKQELKQQMHKVRTKNFQQYKATQFCISQSLEHAQLIRKHMAIKERIERRKRDAIIHQERTLNLEQKRKSRDSLVASVKESCERRKRRMQKSAELLLRQAKEQLEMHKEQRKKRQSEISDLGVVESELVMKLGQTKQQRRSILKKSNNLKQLSNRDIDEIFNKEKSD